MLLGHFNVNLRDLIGERAQVIVDMSDKVGLVSLSRHYLQ